MANKTKHSFKVGERVAAYSGRNRYVGTVDSIYSERLISVVTQCGPVDFHPKQLRKLTPKKPLREVWVNYYPESPEGVIQVDKHGAGYNALRHKGETVLFREVRSKKK